MSGSVWRRLRGRWRHGLLMQELLERIASHHLVVMPYIVTQESVPLAPALSAPDGVHCRELGQGDAAAIVAASVRRRSLDSVIAQLREARSFGAFVGETLIAYTWARTNAVPLTYGGGTLFTLERDEAYVFDVFVHPAHRGRRIAPWLGVEVMRVLASEGRRHCYSLVYLFNRSSRTYKAHVGAQSREWRIALHLDVGGLPGIDLRLRRRGAPLRTPAVRRRLSRKALA